MKNITLSADEHLIRLAREKATREHSTLNAEFRAWLAHYVNTEARHLNYDELMARLGHVQSGGGFSRDELNER